MPRKKVDRGEQEAIWSQAETEFESFGGRVAVNVSGGSASAIAWYRCLQSFGHDRVIPVFADTGSEDEDLYRFLGDCESLFGQPLVKLSQGEDIWDVFDRTGIMRIVKSGNACKASVELKQKPLDAFAAAQNVDAVAIGIQFDEPERMEAFRKRKAPMQVLFPLVARPRMGHCAINDAVSALGLMPPRLYDNDFMHNNCGGACILAGLGQWNAVRQNFPERFEYAKRREAAFHERTWFTILKDQRNNEVKSYTLSQLQEDAEAGRVFPNDWRSNCSCMSSPLFTEDELT